MAPYYYEAEKRVDAYAIIKAIKANFAMGCVIKYLVRAGKKKDSPEYEDLAKAIDYIKDCDYDRTGGNVSLALALLKYFLGDLNQHYYNIIENLILANFALAEVALRKIYEGTEVEEGYKITKCE